MNGQPSPGSHDALVIGCTCAVLDNNHGRFAPWSPDGWWITEGCPVHAQAEAEDPAKQSREKAASDSQ